MHYFIKDRRGAIAIMTAVASSVIALLGLGMVGLFSAYQTKQTLRNVAQAACNRAIKPTRMKIYSDSERTASALTLFDRQASERKLSIVARSISTGWLTATVNAEASTSPLILSAILGNQLKLAVTEQCNGIPPYPAKGDVILNSTFTKPDGTTLPMKYGSWGVYKVTDFGWDYGTGPGVEIQDWGTGYYGTLPAGSKSRYVVELDSDEGTPSNPGNSSMGRTLELHRGVYEFAFWYYGRSSNVLTNRISVYLEGVRPVSPRIQKLSIAEPQSKGWIYANFEIPVNAYSIYRLIIAAEGTDDTIGGNFNDLRLTYVKRPQDL